MKSHIPPSSPAHDRGSIPLVLLAIIALSLTIGALVVTTIGGSQAAQFDEQYTFTVQAADTGAQEGADRLIRAHSSDDLEAQSVPAGCDPASWSSCPVFDSGTGTFNGLAYSWEARKVGPLSWQVRSTGTSPGGVAREVVVEVEDTSRFFIAAFADQGLEMRGGNSADSYGSSAWYTGNGIVGSNESIRLNGGATDVDGVHLYNWDNNDDFGRCRHTGGNGCDDVLATPEAIHPSARIGPPLVVGGPILATDFIDEQRPSCPTPLPNYTASTYDGGSGRLGTAGTSTVLCFASFTVDRDVQVLGEVQVYLYGDLLISNHTSLNCSGCTPGSSTPVASNLRFYLDGGTRVAFGNHSKVAAGIYAIESTCEGNPSNAQANIYGSLICGTISNQGGWSFHYDDRLGLTGSGNYRTSVWREELPTS